MAVKKVIVPIEQALDEYALLKKQEKIITDRKAYLATIIKEHAEKFGVKDDKGSFYASNDTYQWGKQAKTSVSFKEEEAIHFFKEKGYKECIKVVETLDQDAVALRLSVGDVTPDDIENITTKKTTYAVDVKIKEEITATVEETSLPKASMRK